VSIASTEKEGDMLKIGIVTGSARPHRNNEAFARWVLGLAKQSQDADFELVDIADDKLQLVAWGEALKPLRSQGRSVPSAAASLRSDGGRGR
jgi:NAD(P)H-dependent FMN reductase